MIKKLALASIIIIFALSFVSMVRLSQSDNLIITTNTTQQGETNTTKQPEINTTAINASSTPKVLTEALSQHNSPSDCWVVYKNKVYDITSFLPHHPGGVQAIAQYCGTTGFEQAFTAKHGTSKVGMLMKVGVLMGDFDVKGSVA